MLYQKIKFGLLAFVSCIKSLPDRALSIFKKFFCKTSLLKMHFYIYEESPDWKSAKIWRSAQIRLKPSPGGFSRSLNPNLISDLKKNKMADPIWRTFFEKMLNFQKLWHFRGFSGSLSPNLTSDLEKNKMADPIWRTFFQKMINFQKSWHFRGFSG